MKSYVCVFRSIPIQYYMNFSPAAVLPDYAIAVIVIGALILLAVVFCGIGICFACSNSKSKDSKSHTID